MTFEQFIKKAQWQRADNYSGPDMSEYLTGPSHTRDSDHMAESNFQTALEMLGGEDEDAGVEVHRFGHWACGWFEQIMVRTDNKQAAQELYKIYQALEDYPLLDDSDYSERQYEAQQDYARGEQKSLAEALVMQLGLPEELAEDADMLQLAYELNLECQSYYGDDSCININEYHEPDDYRTKQLITILEQLYKQTGDNAAYDYVCAALNVEVRS